MRLTVAPQSVAVVRLEPDEDVPDWVVGGPLCSVTRTDDELSIICPTTSVPDDVPGPVQGPFVAFVIDEVLEFSQVGVLVALLKPLADGGIPCLVLSTFDTDWVFVEAGKVQTAAAVWRAAGYDVVETAPVTVPSSARPDDE